MVLQPHWEISRRYAMFATPIAYLIDEVGVIAGDVAVGEDAILNLLLPALSQRVSRLIRLQRQGSSESLQ